jgi:hypothetical protein
MDDSPPPDESLAPAPADPPVLPTDPEAVPMDIHKPKPVHNLREFLNEIVVIVIGVLIALGLEQAVEAWHWREQVADARDALGDQLGEAIGQGRERINTSACTDARLATLAAMLDQATDSGRLPPIGDIGVPPLRTWSTGNWESAVASQAAEHIPMRTRSIYSLLFGYADVERRASEDELRQWQQLYALAGPGRRIETAEIAGLRDAIINARTDNQVIDFMAIRMQQVIDSVRLPFDRKFALSYDRPRSAYSICQPIGPVPLHYGEAPIRDAIARARSAPQNSADAPSPIAGAARP